MNLQSLRFSAYEFGIRQFRRFGLPSAILLCYLTALGLRRLEILESFGRIEMQLFHRAFGILLITVLVALVYDRIQGRTAPKVALKQAGSAARDQIREIKSRGPRHWVDLMFFSTLGLIALLGLLLHLKTRLHLGGWPGLELLHISHSLLVWYFLALILVKYYLTLTRWFGSLIGYLREN
ncbi:MAG: hypothetical protein RRB13_07715 [bacterium]|nr:hypothetical protein [bacterium]